ncbi:hypothetical protein AAS21_gp168 [Pantoea phage vB_PagS_AAS21]|uniref:Uncharacterized protein n=1 Tax=Pantoea phage vB_PagS_AAS21 TaxID=2575261 RepID=A0A4Y5P1S3_9CAUD|nr:hypothetical protein AAS21_gp168 [Pantoea phage vB_PagS_AAS21]
MDNKELDFLDIFGPTPTERGESLLNKAAKDSMDQMAEVINSADTRLVLPPHLYAQLVSATTEVAKEHGVFNTQSVRAKMESAINKFIKPGYKV